uniref:Cytochrome c oxidase subunit 3 n=1 Tax=Paruterina candelabraria TaxID=2364639 RepID=A0A386HV45_9CEST|nr:cytochrome c oxidase subunit III [Paruterina candelabraria]AYD49578.1 cytochrome c oxidase subunit III [Paruterina candelabraria]
MSVFPLLNSIFVGLVVLTLFTWKIWMLGLLIFISVVSISIYLYDTLIGVYHYESAFWLFVFSEIMVFGSLLFCCLYFDTFYYINLSSSLEIPFVGCFVLLGSSITVTAFHHLLNWYYSSVFLAVTVILGLSFVVLQICEMDDILVNLFDTSFHASSLCTVGLHFSHVLLGIIGLISLLLVGSDKFGEYRCTVLTWYWHFVDYIWLLVYTIVYVC